MPEQTEHQDTQTAQISGTVQIKRDGDQQNANARRPEEEEIPEQKSGRKFIIIAVIILLVIGAGIFYWRSTFTEDTDDAQVDGDLYQVSSRVTGQVVKVYVDDNQQVKAGDPIAEIDPKDYQVAVEQAQANLASSQADAIQANVNVPITSVNVTTTSAPPAPTSRAPRCRRPGTQTGGRRRGSRRRSQGQRSQVPARRRALHPARPEGRHLQAAVRCSRSHRRSQPGLRARGRGHPDR